jgi:hypothetical protein
MRGSAAVRRPGIERIALIATLLATVGAPVVVAAVSLVQRGLEAAITPVWIGATSLLIVGALALWARRGAGPVAALARRLSPDWEGLAGRRPVLAALWAVLALAGALQTTRLACFMADPGHRWGSAFPPVEEGVTHACMSAYVRAAEMSRRGVDNLYADAHYPAYIGGTLGHTARLPSTVDHLSDWIALAIGGARGRVALLLLPAFAASLSFGLDLQFGQVHFVTIALAVVGMIAFARKRDSLGGALLGFAVVVKLFPGLLVVYLALQRRWRAVLSTTAWSIAFALLGLAVLGWTPYQAFLGYHLPRISSGETFSFFLRSDLTIASNWGIYGIPIKLGRLGVPGMTTELASLLSWIYTVPVMVATVIAARRRAPVAEQPLHWIALLALASLRSPLAPNVYTGAPALWLLSLVAVEVRGARRLALFVLAWLAIGGLPPLPGAEATILLWSVGQVAMLGLGFWVALRRRTNAGARVPS